MSLTDINEKIPSTPFSIEVKISDLYYRATAPDKDGNWGKTVGFTGIGKFEIVDTAENPKPTEHPETWTPKEGTKEIWGKLKSGAGWIFLMRSDWVVISSSTSSSSKKETDDKSDKSEEDEEKSVFSVTPGIFTNSSIESSNPVKINSNKNAMLQLSQGKSYTDNNVYTKSKNPNNYSGDEPPLLTGKITNVDYISDITNTLSSIRKSLNIITENSKATFNKYINYYNRFKLPTLNDAFQKGFAHVFFTRPDCNILDRNDGAVSYVKNSNNALVKELTLEGNDSGHDFMLSISNKASSFSLSDEYIESDMYGKTWNGWKIALGRNAVESRTAGEFTISYKDDRELHMYQLHKMWVDYIHNVYNGTYEPKKTYIDNHTIDYAASCYYIITAEDAETIVFWSKYYGVFPTTIPSSQYSWSSGNIIQDPTMDVNYKFSFKEDYNPLALSELNLNSHISSESSYAPVYESQLGHAGTTWVGAPYVQQVTENGSRIYKLRFLQK